jgi:hypothetical protein
LVRRGYEVSLPVRSFGSVSAMMESMPLRFVWRRVHCEGGLGRVRVGVKEGLCF